MCYLQGYIKEPDMTERARARTHTHTHTHTHTCLKNIINCSWCWFSTSPESNFRDRVLGEVEKNCFSALPGKVGHSRLLPWETVHPNLRRCKEEFHSSSSRVGLLTRLGCLQGLCSFNLASSNLLMSFSSSINYGLRLSSLVWRVLTSSICWVLVLWKVKILLCVTT